MTNEPVTLAPADRRTPAVGLVTALPAEARPIVRHFDLAPRGDGRPFRTFGSSRHRLLLTISGVGSPAAAAATGHLCASAPVAACLNVGIAGHADRAIGTTWLAHRVDDVAGDRRWYPPLVFEPPCPTARLRTVSAPCSDYPEDALYDMEAAGFLEAAVPTVGRELAHVLKVVSDNRHHPAAGLDGARVEELVGSALPVVAAVVDALAALADDREARRVEPIGFDEIVAGTHFSTTRRRQLRRQLRRWAALRPEKDAAAWVRDRAGGDAGEVVEALRRRLDEIAPALGGQA